MTTIIEKLQIENQKELKIELLIEYIDKLYYYNVYVDEERIFLDIKELVDHMAKCKNLEYLKLRGFSLHEDQLIRLVKALPNLNEIDLSCDYEPLQKSEKKERKIKVSFRIC